MRCATDRLPAGAPVPAAASSPSGSSLLRSALGHYATGVAIVTTAGADGGPVGLTINSFSSVSLEPPLVLWSLACRSPSLEAFRHAGGFAINVLQRTQHEIALRFARPVPDKFHGVAWQGGAEGFPVLEAALASFECRTHEVLSGGDHLIFVGEVRQVHLRSGEPLVFYRGRFGDLRPPIDNDRKETR